MATLKDLYIAIQEIATTKILHSVLGACDPHLTSAYSNNNNMVWKRNLLRITQ